jgi:hypothetical protein
MVVTLIIITALFAGAAALSSMQLSSTKSSGLVRDKTSSLYCAEAGLAVARNAVITHYSDWNNWLGQSSEPTWLQSLDHDVDGDGVADFTLRLRDNADETVDDNPNVDNDLAVFVVSACVKFGDAPTEVSELIRWSGGGNCYQAQLGGCGGNANAN